MTAAFPTAFVWTKMQAESGQSLDEIIARKEVERAAGDGLFFWGIGNALGDALTRLVAREEFPTVLFSIMRSRPRRQDSKPDATLLWTGYISSGGMLKPLPDHAIVLSRASTAGGDKRRHYALVCRSNRRLRLEKLGSLDVSHFRNFGSLAPRVGASQVTAVVEHYNDPRIFADVEANREALLAFYSQGSTYDVNMRVELAPPYFVRLARPRLAPHDIGQQLDDVVNQHPSATHWREFVRSIHRVAGPLTPSDGMTDDFFERQF